MFKKKIQKKKFERTLKNDLKIWETAETVSVAKTKAKVFNFSDLEKKRINSTRII